MDPQLVIAQAAQLKAEKEAIETNINRSKTLITTVTSDIQKCRDIIILPAPEFIGLPIVGRYVRVEMKRLVDFVNLEAIIILYEGTQYIPVNGSVSHPYNNANFTDWRNAIADDDNIVHTSNRTGAYIELDIGANQLIDNIVVINRKKQSRIFSHPTLVV